MKSDLKIVALMSIGSMMFSHISTAADLAATVNGQVIKQSLVDFIQKEDSQKGRSQDSKSVTNQLVRNELLAQEAVKLGYDKKPEFILKDEMMRRNSLASMVVEDYIKKVSIKDDDLRKEYDKFKNVADKEYSTRHILVGSEQEAKDLIGQLAKGADFAKLAKDKSNDPTTKDKGGLIDWVNKGQLNPALMSVITKLPKGLYSTIPVQSQLGWHVLKLEDVRDVKVPSFDEVKPRLKQTLERRAVNDFVVSLQSKSKIEIK